MDTDPQIEEFPAFKAKKFATLSKTIPFKLLSPIMKIVFYVKEVLNSCNSKCTVRNKSENKGKIIKQTRPKEKHICHLPVPHFSAWQALINHKAKNITFFCFNALHSIFIWQQIAKYKNQKILPENAITLLQDLYFPGDLNSITSRGTIKS